MSKYFVYSYDMGINDYFNDKNSALEFVEEIINGINEDISEYGSTDNVYNPKECDLILCEIVAEMLPMPDYDIEHVNEDIPYLKCYD